MDNASERPRFSEDAGRDLFIATIARRNMKCFVVPQSELSQISLLNTQAIVFSSVGSFLASFVVAIVIDTLIEFDTLRELEGSAAILVYYFATMSGFLSLVFFALCAHSLFTKRSTLNTIKSESVISES